MSLVSPTSSSLDGRGRGGCSPPWVLHELWWGGLSVSGYPPNLTGARHASMELTVPPAVTAPGDNPTGMFLSAHIQLSQLTQTGTVIASPCSHHGSGVWRVVFILPGLGEGWGHLWQPRTRTRRCLCCDTPPLQGFSVTDPLQHQAASSPPF